jgi:hypothetical protein
MPKKPQEVKPLNVKRGDIKSFSPYQMEAAGITLKSDVVYGKNSDIFRLYTNGLTKEQVDSITGFGYEVELSPTQMVTTIQLVIPQPFEANGRNYGSQTTRQTTKGVLTFKKNRLVANNPFERIEGMVRDPQDGLSVEQYLYDDTPQTAGYPTYFYDLRSNGENLGDASTLPWFRTYESGRFFL